MRRKKRRRPQIHSEILIITLLLLKILHQASYRKLLFCIGKEAFENKQEAEIRKIKSHIKAVVLVCRGCKRLVY